MAHGDDGAETAEEALFPGEMPGETGVREGSPQTTRTSRTGMARVAPDRGGMCACPGFQHRSYDRVVSVCALGGVSLGEKLRAAGIIEGGRGNLLVDHR